MSLRSLILDHPTPLVWMWAAVSSFLRAVAPVFRRAGIERSSRWVGVIEHPLKSALFSCRKCGQCVLHSTGMTCPMTCPKQLRNGPCGGVCRDGKCEADPSMDCVWLLAVERAARTRFAPEIHQLNPALDWRLQGSSSWVAYAVGSDRRMPFGGMEERSALDVIDQRGTS